LERALEMERARVFVSYASPDRALCANLIARLVDPAIEVVTHVWYDPLLLPAQEWNEQIAHQLQTADIVLVLASPAFLRSEYCMGRELPLIAKQGRSRGMAVTVVRLRECDIDSPDFAGLALWPPAPATVEGLGDPRRGLAELRTWLKVEICRALVARHADRYLGRSRSAYVAERDEDPGILPSNPPDDLTELHERLGKAVPSRRRLWSSVAAGAVTGAPAGLLVATAAFRGSLSPWRAFAFVAAVSFPAGMLKILFRSIEVAVTERARPRDLHPGAGKGLWWFSWFEAGLAALSGAAFAATFVLVIGLPLGVILWWRGWELDLGLPGAVAAGALVGAYAGYEFAVRFAPKRLRIFDDVRHLFEPPAVAPLPPRSFEQLYESLVKLRAKRVPEALPDRAAPLDAEDTKPSVEAADAAGGGGTEAGNAAPGAALASEPPALSTPSAGEDSLPSSVKVPLLIVATRSRRAEADALRTAIARDGGLDMFALRLIEDDAIAAQEAAFWRSLLAGDGCCVVLMTTELLQSGIAAALQKARRGGARAASMRVYPVLVDKGLPNDAPLMGQQGLPTGQMAVADWPIREAAWTNVARVLLRDMRSTFFYQLAEGLRSQRAKARFVTHERQMGQVEGIERTLLAMDLVDMDIRDPVRELFVDPAVDFANHGFAQRTLYGFWRRAFGWLVAGALWFAVAGFDGGRLRTVVAATGYGVVLAYLALSDTLDYASQRVRWIDDERLAVWPFLTAAGALPRLKRRPILRRSARVLVVPLCLLATALVALPPLFQRYPALAEFPLRNPAAGGLLGLLAYLCSRYRVPTVALRLEIPLPSTPRVERVGLRWSLRMPHVDEGARPRGKLGGADSPSPKLAEGMNMGVVLTPAILGRAMVDGLLLTALFTALMVALPANRLLAALWIVADLHLFSYLVELISRGGQFQRWHRDASAKSWKLAARRSLGPALRSWWHYLPPVAAAIAIEDRHLVRPQHLGAWVMLIGVAIVIVVKRVVSLVDVTLKTRRT
jgi:hypothetical protein